MRVPSEIWVFVFERDKGYCQYCGEDLLASPLAFSCAQVDHVKGVAAGGNNGAENLLLSCSTCNNSLSRASALTTYEERKAVALKGKSKQVEDFKSWASLRERT